MLLSFVHCARRHENQSGPSRIPTAAITNHAALRLHVSNTTIHQYSIIFNPMHHYSNLVQFVGCVNFFKPIATAPVAPTLVCLTKMESSGYGLGGLSPKLQVPWGNGQLRVNGNKPLETHSYFLTIPNDGRAPSRRSCIGLLWRSVVRRGNLHILSRTETDPIYPYKACQCISDISGCKRIDRSHVHSRHSPTSPTAADISIPQLWAQLHRRCSPVAMDVDQLPDSPTSFERAQPPLAVVPCVAWGSADQ